MKKTCPEYQFLGPVIYNLFFYWHNFLYCPSHQKLPGKEFACNVGNMGLIPGSGRSPGEGNDNPLQYFCLENPMDRGTWRATVHRVADAMEVT